MITSHAAQDRNLHVLQYIVFGGAILYFGRDIFVPLSFAALISFVIYPSCRWLEKRGVGRMTAIFINIALLLLVCVVLVLLLVYQLKSFMAEWPLIKEKLDESLYEVSAFITRSYGYTFEEQQNWIARVVNQPGSGLLTMLRQLISASAFSTVLAVLIPVYSALILYYREQWVNVLLRLFPDERRDHLNEILALTITAYYNFIKGMAMVYLIVGALNSIGLLLLGVPHAILFGCIASVLTFIPYVGIVAGSLLPMAMAWITYDSVWYPLGIAGIFTLVQYLEANLIFPMAVSKRMNVNTMATLIAIFAGGLLWGVAGMILFVPFVGILKLIADHNPKLKTIALMLGTASR